MSSRRYTSPILINLQFLFLLCSAPFRVKENRDGVLVVEKFWLQKVICGLVYSSQCYCTMGIMKRSFAALWEQRLIAPGNPLPHFDFVNLILYNVHFLLHSYIHMFHSKAVLRFVKELVKFSKLYCRPKSGQSQNLLLSPLFTYAVTILAITLSGITPTVSENLVVTPELTRARFDRLINWVQIGSSYNVTVLTELTAKRVAHIVFNFALRLRVCVNLTYFAYFLVFFAIGYDFRKQVTSGNLTGLQASLRKCLAIYRLTRSYDKVYGSSAFVMVIADVLFASLQLCKFGHIRSVHGNPGFLSWFTQYTLLLVSMYTLGALLPYKMRCMRLLLKRRDQNGFTKQRLAVITMHWVENGRCCITARLCPINFNLLCQGLCFIMTVFLVSTTT